MVESIKNDDHISWPRLNHWVHQKLIWVLLGKKKMNLTKLIAVFNKRLEQHPEHKDTEIRSVDIDVAATPTNIKFDTNNGQLSISNGNFTD